MAIKVGRKHLQKIGDNYKYKYTWKRDNGDGEYAGKLDRIKVDKDEGYEVQYFIQSLMNKHELTTVDDVHKIEDALQTPALSSTVMRDVLIAEVESILGL